MGENELTVRDRADILSVQEIKLYEKLLRVVDRNPVLDFKQDEHNVDFCIIKGNVEITRNFSLKAVKVGRFGYEVVRHEYVTTGEVVNIASDVRVWEWEHPEHYITESGGCSTSEVEAKSKKQKGGSTERKFHDALSISVTRGLKRGLEGMVGIPFINIMIKELFGSFQEKKGERKERFAGRSSAADKSPREDRESRIRGLGNEIFARIKQMIADKIVSQEEANELWNDCIKDMDDPGKLEGRLKDLEKAVK